MKESEQRIPVKYQLIVAIFIPAIVLPTVYFAFYVAPSLGIDFKKMSAFSAFRTLLTLVFFPIIVPVCVFSEFLSKDWKKGKFLWRSVFTGLGVFCVSLGVTFLLLTLFDILFSELSLIWQIPLMASSGSAGLIVYSLVVGNKRFKKYAKEKLGW